MRQIHDIFGHALWLVRQPIRLCIHVGVEISMQIKSVHPGEYLKEILDDLDVSARSLASHIGVSPVRVSKVLRSKEPVTAELAFLFAKALGTSPRYWLSLQVHYDLAMVQDSPPE